MAITGVLRAGHVAIRVLDLQAAHKHYTKVLGLIEVARDSSNRVYLKGWDEHDHHSVVLREADAPGMDYMGFKVAAKELLPRFERDLKAAGCTVERIPAGEHIGCGERIRFQVPTGHVIELYAEKELVGNGLPTVNPDPWPEGLLGMQVTRFDHCLLYGDDVDGTVKIFRDVLGFDLAEQVMAGEAMIGAFLTCGAKPHDVAFIKDGGKGKFHHASFYLNNWGDVLRAADIISKHNVSHDIGPTRHGITRGETVYFFDPSGNRNEVFSGGYIRYPDHPTITWTDNELGKAIFYHDRKLNERFLSVTT